MSTRHYVAVAAVSLALAGCGSTTGTAEGPPVSDLPPLPDRVAAQADPGTDAPPDDAALSARLIGIADVPSGFAVVDLPPSSADENNDSETDDSDRSSTDPQACAAILAPVATQVPGAVSTASVTFTGSDFASIDEDIATYQGDGAARAFETMQDVLPSCRTFSGTDADGVEVQYRVGGSSVVTPGSSNSASFAIRVESSSEGVTITSDAVVTQVGNSVVQVIGTGQDAFDADVLGRIAETAAQRL